jgi:hypothetical protein
MANFTRTQLDAVWITGYQAPPADYEDLDRKAFQGVNGKVGGVYAPTAVIAITGAGLQTTTKLEVQAGGNVRFATGATMVLADNDWQDLLAGHPGRTRKIYQAMAPVNPIGQNHFAVMNVVPTGAVQTVACSLRRSTGTTSPEFIKRLRVHNGSTLARVRIRFQVPTVHGAVPQKMPRARLFRVKVVDGVAEDLVTTTLNDGFVDFTTPKSGDAWHNGGAVQEFVITPDKNKTVDAGTYNYFLHIQEESVGVDATPLSVKVYEQTLNAASVGVNAFSGVCDGLAQASGKLVLFKNEINPANNGVYVSPGGAGGWPRVSDLNTTPHFANGMLFPIFASAAVIFGFSSPGTVWQLSVSQDFTLGTSPATFRKPVPYGNIYLGAMVEFEDITTTAPQ